MTRWSATGMVAVSLSALVFSATDSAAEDWRQFKYDRGHCGNVADREVRPPLGLVGAVALTDAVFAAPVLAGGRAYVVDGSGVAFCVDARTLGVVWKFATGGGKKRVDILR